MARNRVHLAAPIEQVFDFLADPCRYPEWVVGAHRVREQDDEFPAVGSRFHHQVGTGPISLSDHTEVVEVEPPRRLVLLAKARPIGTARIEIDLRESAGGTEVLLEETPGDRLTSILAGNPVADTILRLRNAEALARLKRRVEGTPPRSPICRREIAGQRVLVTGGSSGVGLAVAELLGREGAEVAILARGEEGLDAARERLAQAAVEARPIAADVTDRAALDAAVEEAAAELGGLDVVITAAASLAFGHFAETDPADFDRTVATVLLGTVDTIRAALPHLERSSGAVVAIGSTAARMPLPGLSAYTASKHGIAGFLESIRIELEEEGSPVTISLVNPGAVDTPLWDNLESSTGLLPPAPPDLYSPEAVAEAVASVVRRPRDEVTVGGFAGLQVALYRHLGGLAKRALGALARLESTAGDRPADEGALSGPKGSGRTRGGFGGRGSLAAKGFGALEGLRRGIGRS